MRHRIGEIGGRVDVSSTAGSGTIVAFQVPLDFRQPISGGSTQEMIHDG